MADTPAPTGSPAGGGPAAAQGFTTPIALLQLLNAMINGNAFSRGMAAAQLARMGFSRFAPNMVGGTAGRAAGGVLGAAALAYNLYNIINSRASNARKGLESAKAAASLIPVYGQLFAIQQAANNLAQRTAAKSGSPQVRAFSRGSANILQPAHVNAFESLVTGEGKLKDMAKNSSLSDWAPPVDGAFMKALGLDPKFNTMTGGTEFRKGLNYITNYTQDLGNLKVDDPASYNMEPGKFAQFSPEARAHAHALGNLLAVFSPAYAKDRTAYGGQAMNVLLNNLGNELPTKSKAVFQRLGIGNADMALEQILKANEDPKNPGRYLLPEKDLQGVWNSINAAFGNTKVAPLAEVLKAREAWKARQQQAAQQTAAATQQRNAQLTRANPGVVMGGY